MSATILKGINDMFHSEFPSLFGWLIVAVGLFIISSLVLLGHTIKTFQVESNIKNHCYVESLVAKETFDTKACVDKFKNRLLWGEFK
jgi:hypothetical protein